MEMDGDGGGSTRRLDRAAELGLTRTVLALCLFWVVLVGPIVADLTAQGAPRFALTGALVDDRTIIIDDYLVGVDFAERDGHTYSDKAPGQEVLAVPVYAAARLVGADAAIVPRVKENLSLWWVTWWSAGVPVVAIIAMVAVACHRRGTPIPPLALATLAFGTMLLPYAVNLYGHTLAAALGFGAWLVADGGPGTWRRGAAIGALLGLGVTVEYPVAIIAVVVLGLLAVRRRWIEAAAACLAGLPFAIGLAAYQTAAFGSPLSSGYSDKPAHEGSSAFVTGLPDPRTLAESLLGSRGLFLFTPIVAIGLFGLVARWRRTRDDGALVGIAVTIGFFLLQAGWVNPWGGESPGPRYVVPMLPFIALGLAEVWDKVSRPIQLAVAGLSIVSMALASVTLIHIGDGAALIGGHLSNIRNEGFNPTVWSILFGPAGWAIYLASVVGAGWLLVQAHRHDATPGQTADPSPATTVT